MSWFHRSPSKSENRRELETLRASVARLEADLDFYRKQNERIAHDAAPVLRENAVLRYELYKCQSNRQVLEFHVQGSRAEANAALALLNRLAPRAVPVGEALLEAVLLLVAEARALGMARLELEGLEAKAQALWKESKGTCWSFDGSRWLALRVGGLLYALEREREKLLQAAESTADGLSAFDPGLAALSENVRQLVAGLAASLAEPET